MLIEDIQPVEIINWYHMFSGAANSTTKNVTHNIRQLKSTVLGDKQ